MPTGMCDDPIDICTRVYWAASVMPYRVDAESNRMPTQLDEPVQPVAHPLGHARADVIDQASLRPVWREPPSPGRRLERR